MPTAPKELFERHGYAWAGAVPWGTRPRTPRPGVYVVSLSPDPACATGRPADLVAAAKVAAWIARVPTLLLDGQRPDAATVVARLQSFWLEDEAIVYIGKATSLSNRVGQYYRTPLGDRKPHAGGHWIQTLFALDGLTVHYAEVLDRDPEAAEHDMMRTFYEGVSPASRGRHPQPGLALPFANLEGPGGRRAHGLRGTKLAGRAPDFTPDGPASPPTDLHARPALVGSWEKANARGMTEGGSFPPEGESCLPRASRAVGGGTAQATNRGGKTMKGKTEFTASDTETIRQLLKEKERADRGRQKTLREKIRAFRFYISDFVDDQQGFTSRDFGDLIKRGAVTVIG